MEMHAIQPNQASMSSGCIVANPSMTGILLTAGDCKKLCLAKIWPEEGQTGRLLTQ
jgi:hypothetical protein